jgi:hypothetical protein
MVPASSSSGLKDRGQETPLVLPDHNAQVQPVRWASLATLVLTASGASG